MLKAVEPVRSLKQYHPPLGGRNGTRLDFNENTVGCSPRVLARLRSLTAEDLAKYPEREPVERAVADWLGIAPGAVLLTNGVDEAIHLLAETYLERGAEALVAVPTFSMYEIYAAATGARVITVQAEGNFRFPLNRLLDQITPATRLIAIANPNNPTGTVAPPEWLARIAHAAPKSAVLIDEAYFDFYGSTLAGEIGHLPNLFIARTFSKAYGMAGLRIGALAGAASQIEMVKRVASPYSVNSVALACLPEAISDSAYVSDYVAAIRRNRERLESELAAVGLTYWKSEANFVLVRIGSRREAFIAGMRDRGILVRDRDSDPGCAGCVRITVGSDEQTGRLLESLRALVPQLRAASEVSA